MGEKFSFWSELVGEKQWGTKINILTKQGWNIFYTVIFATSMFLLLLPATSGFSRVNFARVIFAIVNYIRVIWVNFAKEIFSTGIFAKVNLDRVSFIRVSLVGVSFGIANFVRVNFSWAIFGKCRFCNSLVLWCDKYPIVVVALLTFLVA